MVLHGIAAGVFRVRRSFHSDGSLSKHSSLFISVAYLLLSMSVRLLFWHPGNHLLVIRPYEHNLNLPRCVSYPLVTQLLGKVAMTAMFLFVKEK